MHSEMLVVMWCRCLTHFAIANMSDGHKSRPSAPTFKSLSETLSGQATCTLLFSVQGKKALDEFFVCILSHLLV